MIAYYLKSKRAGVTPPFLLTMKLKRTYIVLLLFVSGILFSLSSQAANETGPDNNFYIVQDCSNDWLVYNQRFQNYTPYTQSADEAELSVSLLLDLLKNRRYTLLIHTQKENYLFIEGSLQKKIEPGQWVQLSIDSLLRKTRKEEILLTLYGSQGIAGKEVYIANPKTVTPEITEEAAPSIINIKPKKFNRFDDFSVIVLIVILIINLLTYYTSPYSYGRFINPLEYFDRSDRNEMYKLSKPFSQEIILFVTLTSSVISYLLLVLSQSGLNLFSSGIFLSDGYTFLQFATNYLTLFLFTFVIFYLKYLFMSLVGGVLNLAPVINLHFLKVLQSSFLFYAGIVVLVFSYSSYYPLWPVAINEILLITAFSFYLFRFISLYLLINSKGPFINLYLFSYLCVIEMFPLIIAVKFAL